MSSPSQPTMSSTLFSQEDIDLGLKKLTNHKDVDMQEMQAEMLKWFGDEATTWIHDLFNKAMENGMPNEWTHNWIKPIHKTGERSIASNYRTIMVGSTMAKLFGTVMENKISSWTEENSKCTKSREGFRKHHSTTYHLVALRVMMEESRLRDEGLYYCFVDFKKAFDMIPRKKLWERMEKLGVLEEYKTTVAKIYEKVKCVVRMGGQQSSFFSSDIRVK